MLPSFPPSLLHTGSSHKGSKAKDSVHDSVMFVLQVLGPHGLDILLCFAPECPTPSTASQQGTIQHLVTECCVMIHYTPYTPSLHTIILTTIDTHANIFLLYIFLRLLHSFYHICSLVQHATKAGKEPGNKTT